MLQKRFLPLLTILLFGFGCRSTLVNLPATSNVVIPQVSLPAKNSSASQIVTPTITGHYEMLGSDHYFDLNLVSTTTIKLYGFTEWQGDASGAVNPAEVRGFMELENNSADYQDRDTADCKLHFSFTENTIKVDDPNVACGGLNASFEGEYKKIPSAAPRADWSLMDYYTALRPEVLPDEFGMITLDKATMGDFNKKIILDKKNYYMFLPLDDGLNTQMAVFLRPNHIGLVGIVNTHCGPRCSQGTHFFDFQNGEWVEVTSKVFPEINTEEVVAAFKKIEPDKAAGDDQGEGPYALFEPELVLPQHGTTIKLIDSWADKETVLMSWHWTGEKFEKIIPN